MSSVYLEPQTNLDEQKMNNLQNIVDHSKKQKTPLILGGDFNSHHTLWNSKKTTNRGTALAEFITKNNLFILNKGNTPTYEARNHESIIDLTIVNSAALNMFQNWKVDQTPSLSDHKMIRFELTEGTEWTTYTKDYKNFDTNIFINEISNHMNMSPFKYSKGLTKISDSMNYINNCMTSALEKASPVIKTTHKTSIPWNEECNKSKNKLINLKKEKKAMKAKANIPNTSQQTDIDEINFDIKEAEKLYKQNINIIKKEDKRNYISNLKNPKDLAKLPKKNYEPNHNLNNLRNPDGTLTNNPEETIKCLADKHFPLEDIEIQELPQLIHDDILITEEIITDSILNKIIKSLPKNKAPGMDKITNEMISLAWEVLKEPIKHIYKESIKHSTLPNQWQDIKGISIPKPGKDDYLNPKNYRIISLTSNLQKILEKAILNYLENTTKIDKKLTSNQFGFRKNKSTSAANHRLTTKIENALANKQYALGIFLDVEAAFDKIHFHSIYKAMQDAMIPKIIINWIYSMLTNRNMVLEFKGHKIIRKIKRGCPQGGILSPLLWNLTLNTLLILSELDKDFLQAFADDLGILIPGFDLNCTMRDKAICFLKIINKWCKNNGVNLSALKTKVIIFRQINKKFNFDPIFINNTKLELSDEVTYLGLKYDKHLSWAPHIKNKVTKTIKLLNMTRNYTSKKWGISPAQCRWIFKQVILPNLTYEGFIWSHRINDTKYLRNLLEKVQKLATLQITGGHRNSPNITLSTIAGLYPIDVHLEQISVKTMIRLIAEENWQLKLVHEKKNTHQKYLENIYLNLNNKPDDLIKKTNITQNFSISTDPTNIPQIPQPPNTLHVYTDGSVQKTSNASHSGAGYVIYNNNNKNIQEMEIKLVSTTTINQCELLAIQSAAKYLKNSNTEQKIIKFYSDSMSSIQALTKPFTKSKTVLETVDTLNKLSDMNVVSLTKVKAHANIEGNEKADSLAKNGATSNKHPIKSLCGLQTTINELTEKATNASLAKINSQKINKNQIEITEFLFKTHKGQLITKDKQTLRNLTQIITDQNTLANSNHHKDKSISPYCSTCKKEKETAEHVMCICPALMHKRQIIFGSTNDNFIELFRNHNLRTINKFITESNRLNNHNYYTIPDE